MRLKPAELAAAVARAAEALDELRTELTRVDRLLADQQVRIAKLYPLPSGIEASAEDGG
jgi:hypothetical protein